MPLIVLETKDLTTPLFWVRTWEILSSCTTFSLASTLEPFPLEQNLNRSQFEHFELFRVYCMFTWCSFFILTLLIHILSVLQFHSLLPISWKNLTVTVAMLGALLSFSSALILFLSVKDLHVLPHTVATLVFACLTFFAYASESVILCRKPLEQRGYMGKMSGILKVIQLWGCSQMIPIMIKLHGFPGKGVSWQLTVAWVTYTVCFLTCLVTLVVIIGDCAGRCPLPFDKCLTAFILIGMLLYLVTTVISYTEILKLIKGHTRNKKGIMLIVKETVDASLTLLAYTVDFALSIKLMCHRGHS